MSDIVKKNTNLLYTKWYELWKVHQNPITRRLSKIQTKYININASVYLQICSLNFIDKNVYESNLKK